MIQSSPAAFKNRKSRGPCLIVTAQERKPANMNEPKRERSPAKGGMATVYQLNLRHLRGMLAVHEHGSISSAAAAVNLSQPALTQGILKLENQLGEVLFERRSDGMVPTS